MAWIYLIIAGLLEIGWPVGIKMSSTEETKWLGTIVATVFMISSGFFLWLAQKSIPIGTAYAVWTGIGAAGAFFMGITFYNDPVTFGRIAGVMLIICGVVTLKLASH